MNQCCARLLLLLLLLCPGLQQAWQWQSQQSHSNMVAQRLCTVLRCNCSSWALHAQAADSRLAELETQQPEPRMCSHLHRGSQRRGMAGQLAHVAASRSETWMCALQNAAASHAVAHALQQLLLRGDLLLLRKKEPGELRLHRQMHTRVSKTVVFRLVNAGGQGCCILTAREVRRQMALVCRLHGVMTAHGRQGAIGAHMLLPLCFLLPLLPLQLVALQRAGQLLVRAKGHARRQHGTHRHIAAAPANAAGGAPAPLLRGRQLAQHVRWRVRRRRGPLHRNRSMFEA